MNQEIILRIIQNLNKLGVRSELLSQTPIKIKISSKNQEKLDLKYKVAFENIDYHFDKDDVSGDEKSRHVEKGRKMLSQIKKQNSMNLLKIFKILHQFYKTKAINYEEVLILDIMHTYAVLKLNSIYLSEAKNKEIFSDFNLFLENYKNE